MSGKFFLAALMVMPLVCSCDDWLLNLGQVGDKDIVSMSLGYNTVVESKKKKKVENRVTLLNSEDARKAKESAGKSYVFQLDENSLEKQEDAYVLTVAYYPDDAYVTAVTLASSDTNVIAVKRVGLVDFEVRTKAIGAADLTLTVDSKETHIQKYQVGVVSTIDVRCYVSSFWLSESNARIKYKCTGVPSDLKEVSFLVSDSVTVVGQCEYYDYKVTGSAAQVIRDTTTFPLVEHTDKFKKGRKKLLRNVSSAVRKYNSGMKHEGTAITVYPGGKADTLASSYSFKCSHVDLNLNIACLNPRIRFNVGAYQDKTNDGADGKDAGTDADEVDENDEGQNDVKADETYFTVSFNDGMDAYVRDSLLKANSDSLHLSSAQRDSLQKEMDKHYKEREIK